MKHHCHNYDLNYSRRDFLSKTSLGLGSLGLASALNGDLMANQGVLGQTHQPARAKRVIYLFQSGGPSQLDLWDHKPLLNERNGEELPDSVRKGQRLTGMSSGQASFPMAGSVFNFRPYGQSGQMISDLSPHVAQVADDLCLVKSMYTEAINHDPAATFLQTGSQLPGRPSIGAWLSYGLGTDNRDLPSFVVLVTKDKRGQPLYSRLWGNGFLPSEHQGVQFRASRDAVLYLNNPDGVDRADRRRQLDLLQELQKRQFDEVGDPEIMARMAQYEMAFRMQMSVPEVTDMSQEPEHIFKLYGPDAKKPGSYAANCLQARRLAERGVKFIQLYHQGWDQHGGLPGGIRGQCRETDQATAGLLIDLKQRGLLEDTLVIWGGEFGRTNYSQGQLTKTNYGRDHHPKCFSIWMAGAGVKKGTSYGMTDEFGYNVAEDGVHVHDLQATLLHLLGVDHERLTYRFQGRRYRLTDVHGRVVKGLLS